MVAVEVVEGGVGALELIAGDLAVIVRVHLVDTSQPRGRTAVGQFTGGLGERFFVRGIGTGGRAVGAGQRSVGPGAAGCQVGGGKLGRVEFVVAVCVEAVKGGDPALEFLASDHAVLVGIHGSQVFLPPLSGREVGPREGGDLAGLEFPVVVGVVPLEQPLVEPLGGFLNLGRLNDGVAVGVFQDRVAWGLSGVGGGLGCGETAADRTGQAEAGREPFEKAHGLISV